MSDFIRLCFISWDLSLSLLGIVIGLIFIIYLTVECLLENLFGKEK